MAVEELLIFPDLFCLNDCGGDFEKYFSEVYAIFEQHFIKSKNYFNGVIVTAPRFPLEDGIHKTFYHITHAGEYEHNRQPDLRRMERIRFPKFYIDECPHDELLVWENQRGNQKRILIFNENEGYLLVLTNRVKYHLLCTAYCIEHNNRKRKLIAEYETYKNAETAQ